MNKKNKSIIININKNNKNFKILYPIIKWNKTITFTEKISIYTFSNETIFLNSGK